MSDVVIYSKSDFESAKQHTDEGVEFWYARDLKDLLEYGQWRNFLNVVEKAKESCENAKNDIGDHFADVSKMVEIGSDTKRNIDDIMLSRYACYLIVQNGDPRKKIIALGQTYFAVKTRERENEEAFIEDQKRFAIRNELKTHNKSLAEAAHMSGVETPKDHAIFQNKGYQGLYKGLGAKEIHKRKGLAENQKILDHMGSTELAANLFRATQTDDKLRRENIRGKENANKTHHDVGKKVRQTIEELGGTMPEDLEMPDKSIKEIEKKHKRDRKKAWGKIVAGGRGMKQEIKERVERIRNGEVPEGYQKTKVGIIPVDWDNKKLIQIADYVDYRGKTPQKTNNGVFLVTAKNIKKGFIDYETSKEFVSENKYMDIMSRGLPKLGDVLITTEAPVGNIAQIDKENIALAQRVIKYRGKEDEIDNTYMKFYFLGFKFQKEILIESTGGTVQGIKGSRLHKLKVSFPKIKEQEKIAEILSTWDKAIDLKEKLIEEKKEFKRGLMQKLLVGKIRFKEYVKSPNLQEVKRYSTLPEDWSAKKASSIFSNVSIKNNGNEQLLSATQNNGVIPRDMLDGDVMSPSGSTKGYKLVEDGDFVISLRSFQGGIEYSSYRGIISPAYTVIKNKIPICADFYRYIFKSKLFIDRLASSVIGIRDGKQISYGDFSFMFLPYPELKEQEKIAFSLKNLDDNIELLELELNHLKEQKRGLMQLLLTGIVRVEVN